MSPQVRFLARERTSGLTASIVTGFGGLRIPIGPPSLSLYGIVGARNFTDTISVTLSPGVRL